MPAVPAPVVILGLGPSLEGYIDYVKRLGSRHAYADEVWAINAAADVIQCDRVFHMDDVRIQQIRANARPRSNISNMLTWLRTHPGPIYTSRLHPDYPGLVEYPLEAVINSCGIAYINNTAAAAVAFAVHIGVQQISLWGCDYTYANAHDAERGRACTEFHLGIAKARGIRIGLGNATSLMDACEHEASGLYGYDTLDLDISGGGDQPVQVRFTPKAVLPTAEEIERAYDHTRNPNPLVKD